MMRFWNKVKNVIIKIPPFSFFLYMKQEMQDISHRIWALDAKVAAMKKSQISNYLEKHLYSNPKYRDAKKLNGFEYQVYSQNGEDGIIQEIFQRIGTTNQCFIEFGMQDGLECNTTYLLAAKNWQGLWVEANDKAFERIKNKFQNMIARRKLFLHHGRVTAENVQQIFDRYDVSEEPDLLSIDIDGNDYWVWQGISRYRPRVVIIEYNALFRPNDKWVMKHQPKYSNNTSCYFGASLKSLEILGKEKGYCLVGCNFHGVNAFFVREDLAKGKFLEPFTAEVHYEPPKYYLLEYFSRRRDFGEFENI